jgi:hypothetical protein
MKQEVNKMEKTNKKDDKSTWAIGGGILIGLGSGLMVTSIISSVKQK